MTPFFIFSAQNICLAAEAVLPDRRGGRFRPPIFFLEKKTGRGRSKRKLLAGQDRPDHSTGLSAAFAVTSPPPAPGPALSASLSATWAGIGSRSSGSRRTGRLLQEAAQAAKAAEGAGDTRSASAGISAETVPRPCAARERQVRWMTSPVNFWGFLGGEILRTVRRPLAIRSDNFIPLSVLLPTFPTWEK